ncbi:hypothetical protein BGZ99_005084 [Dissophora globulifera]|uniref:Uncharacterized protein n=1 Tax=Dissophora globulifera TaxID=979702 RepID=A0A9P6RFY7_9FUNG|nr:hypothetical protein BGZ99_005084 [Dissophora globulifera]
MLAESPTLDTSDLTILPSSSTTGFISTVMAEASTFAVASHATDEGGNHGHGLDNPHLSAVRELSGKDRHTPRTLSTRPLPSTAVVIDTLAIAEPAPLPTLAPVESYPLDGSGGSDFQRWGDSASGNEGINDQASVNREVNPTMAADYNLSVAQMSMDFPRSLYSQKESHSRKSPSLPPLKTTLAISSAIGTTSTATACGPDIVPPHHHPLSSSVAMTPPVECVFNEGSLLNSSSIKATANSDIAGSTWIEGTDHCAAIEGRHDTSHAGYDPTYTPSAAVSSTADYFSPYILPPIPSFTEIGLSFDKARATNSSRQSGNMLTSHNDTQPSTVRQDQIVDCVISNDAVRHSDYHISQITTERPGQRVVPEYEPDYNPSIFDYIHSDDNEAYILWSTPSDAGVGTGFSSSSATGDPVSATSQGSSSNRQVGVPTATTHNHNPPPSSLSSQDPSSATKRWSAGETFKGRDKGRDSFENERAHAHKISDGSNPESVPRPNSVPDGAPAAAVMTQSSNDMCSGVSNPSSPSYPRPLERFNGTISIRPVSSVGLSSHKSASTSATAAASSAPSEERAIMAATVEKLVEKLTSEIDYTFLTDFFLIYRLFISPLALLKLLLARFRWALTEDTPQRQIVRVRTFVTMRHWLLNYFEYDFMGSKVLRRTLVQSLRSLTEHHIVASSVRDQRIVRELRKLFQLKRKTHSREMAQMALERTSRRPIEEVSPRSSQQRRPVNLEWTLKTATSSKRSSVETGGTKQTRFQQSAFVQGGDQFNRSDDEGPSAGESTDQEFDISSTGSRSEDDMYEEEAHYMIHSGHPQHTQNSSDDGTGDTDLDDDSADEEQPHTATDDLSSSGHLPSPAFSSESSKSQKAQQDYVESQSLIENKTKDLPTGTAAPFRSHSRRVHSLDAPPTDHASYHHCNHTGPRTHDTQLHQPRAVSYVDASIDSSSSYALSPPDSPRPLEPYINPPPRISTLAPLSDKKKTFSQYMNATVEQFSKVKRVFLPKPSIQDLRHHSNSSMSSHSLIVVQPTVGNGARRGSVQEMSSMGYAASYNTSKYFNDERLYYGNSSKASQPSGAIHSSVGTNSIALSSDGRLLRDELHTVEQTRRQSVASMEWSSSEDDDCVKSASTSRSNELTSMRGKAGCVDALLLSKKLEREQISASSVGGDGRGSKETTTVYDVVDGNSRRQNPRLTATSRRHSLQLDEMVATKEVLNHDQDAVDWDGGDNHDDEYLDGDDDDLSSPPSLVPSSSKRILRRTSQKRDNRASWMTYSSTNSSVFGAVISQGHLPPSQAIKDRADAGNVDRFMERLYKGEQQPSSSTPEPNNDGSESRSPNRHGVHGMSTEGIHDRTSQDGSSRFSSLSEATDNTNSSKVMSSFGGLDNYLSSTTTSDRRGRTLAQHPHRRTMPIMHHHFHHHHLQHRQSESLLQGYQQQRRHSAEVQTLGGWTTSLPQQQQRHYQQHSERKTTQELLATANSAQQQQGPNPTSVALLEGAAYAAALQETQRQLRLLINQDNGSGQGVLRQAPRVPPHPPGRPQGQVPPRPLAAMSISSAALLSSPQPTASQTRSSSDPHLLQMAADAEITPPITTRGPLKSNPGTRGPNTISQIYASMYSPVQNTHHHHHYHHHHSHESSYNQQRSPMNPRFQSIISPTRDAPSSSRSIMLRNRSELIAQQLCLIEREYLNQVPWYELVNAGWKKKPTDTTAMSSLPSSGEAMEAAGESALGSEGRGGKMVSDVGTLAQSDTDPQTVAPVPAATSKRATSPWPLSRTQTSQTVRTHTQRFAHPGHTNDSPSVTQLVDRFNLMCHWVSSEIVKTTDLDTRVRVVEKFIRIAHTCYNHSNFSSLTQIMLGLQVHEVSRLSRTWALVRPQEARIMQELQEFTSMLHNWKHLRNAMKNIADEWGGATATAAPTPSGYQQQQQQHQQQQQRDGSSKASTVTTLSTSPGNSGKQNLIGGVGVNLFNKMAGKDKEKEKDRGAQTGGHHPRHISHHHSSSFGKSSLQSISSSGHHKAVSGPVYPSLVSSLTKDKDRDGAQPQHPLQSQQQQPQPQQQQRHGGSIPLLAVYLSDLLYNTELPSYIGPKVPASFPMHHQATVDNTVHQLPSPPQSAMFGAAQTVPNVNDKTYALGAPSLSTLPLMVNMHKHRTIATIVKRILAFRTMANRYPFVKEPEIYDQLMAVEAVEQQEMERLSELCEEKASSTSPASASTLASPAFTK